MNQPPSFGLTKIRQVLDRLLDPESGCPWDRRQTPDSLGLYLLEETYELLEAIENRDEAAVFEEMGDCFFILGFLARLLQNQSGLDEDKVLEAAADKIISRHPHVFGESPSLKTAEDVREKWHQLKRKEKAGGSFLEGVPQNMPALLRAHRLTERAGRAGFDWENPEAVLETLDQELGELKKAAQAGDQGRVQAEFGDVLFTLANLGRHLGVNAEDALHKANRRFTQRFQYIEQALARQGRSLEETTLDEMDRLWAEAKSQGL